MKITNRNIFRKFKFGFLTPKNSSVETRCSFDSGHYSNNKLALFRLDRIFALAVTYSLIPNLFRRRKFRYLGRLVNVWPRCHVSHRNSGYLPHHHPLKPPQRALRTGKNWNISLWHRHTFNSLAFKILGPMNSKSAVFFKHAGSTLISLHWWHRKTFFFSPTTF